MNWDDIPGDQHVSILGKNFGQISEKGDLSLILLLLSLWRLRFPLRAKSTIIYDKENT
jgi:hypothetical protein